MIERKNLRIWYQSSAPLGKDPLWKPYEETLQNHLQGVARPGTTVDIHGLDVPVSAVEKSHYLAYLNMARWIENARTAEEEGYNAFVNGCMLDLGYLQIREVVDIPVAFASESSFHLACILAHRFSLLAPNEELLLLTEERVRQYGLRERFVPSSCFNIGVEELRGGFSNPAPVIEAVQQEARRAIRSGAGILVPSCNILGMVLMKSGIRDIDGVPILDNVGVGIKVVEMLVELKQVGVTRSKKGFYAALSKEELSSIRKLYGYAKR